MPSDEPPCQSEACALQDCLNKNTYRPDACDGNLRKLYECCQRMYKTTSDKGESTACPAPEVLHRWLKNHPK
ncbi:DUF1903-domain-containing protein [Crepidotus variabilis]|uniref:Cx9C motif-containing protein 4, mitochondrial n=1 Tax=Crepidotus variabilis TaxID=179855 RepID=A0A9P6JJY9_9AGAR|nr:DUF1903-domain-containing protein [Crepidotus variabilis]